MVQILVLSTSDDSPRLTLDEANALAAFCYEFHNHQATHPQPAMFWWRDPDAKTRMN